MQKDGSQAGQMAGVTCLIVDDNEVDRRIVRSSLAKLQPLPTLHEADSITAARALLRRIKPDVILLDHVLPDGRGAAYALELLSSPAMSKVAVRVMSSSDLSHLDTAVQSVAKDNLTPLFFRELIPQLRAEAQIEVADSPTKDPAMSAAVMHGRDAAVGQMLRTLRRVRRSCSTRIPKDAARDLDVLEDMLLSFADEPARLNAHQGQGPERATPAP